MILNDEQEKVVQAAVHFYKHTSDQVFQFTGPPGTGKSVVLFEILKRLKLPLTEVAPMAFTGAAAIVMRLKGLINAKTIHSWLYEAIESPLLDDSGKVIMDNYLNRPVMTLRFVPKDLTGIRLIIFDEGWTVPLHMKKHIMEIGAKIIVAGDPDQLPPVADDPAFFTSGKIYRLTQIMRQAAGSPIVYLSQRAIKGLPIHTGMYGGALVICEDELTNDMIQLIVNERQKSDKNCVLYHVLKYHFSDLVLENDTLDTSLECKIKPGYLVPGYYKYLFKYTSYGKRRRRSWTVVESLNDKNNKGEDVNEA